MGFIEKLFDEGVYAAEDFGHNQTFEYKQETALLRDIESEFLKNLSEEKKKFYEEELIAQRLKVESIEQKRMFEYAFRLACSVMKDCLVGGDLVDFQL